MLRTKYNATKNKSINIMIAGTNDKNEESDLL